MDPLENLKQQRRIALRIIQHYDDASVGVSPDDAATLAELVLALDTWRLEGGFDPYTTGGFIAS